MKVIIVAAGEGSRLRPLTLKRPKCLVEVNGIPLLDYQLGVIRDEGIDEIVLVKGYLAEVLNPEGVKSYINPEYDRTNMVWSLFCAEQELHGDVIVTYGDIVYSRQALRYLIASPRDISVVVDRDWESYWRKRFDNPLQDAESLKLDSEGRIIEIGQSPVSLEDIEGQYIGLMKFNAGGLSIIKSIFKEAVISGELRGKNPDNAYMTDLLQAVIDAGYEIWPVYIDGGWVEIDSIDDLNLDITFERIMSIQKTK